MGYAVEYDVGVFSFVGLAKKESVVGHQEGGW